MVYEYVVTLKNTSRQYIDRFSLLLLTISALLFFREQYFSAHIKMAILFAGLAIAVMMAYNIYRQQQQQLVAYSIALFIAAIAWLAMPYLNWLFLPFALMGLFERQAKKPLEIGFADTGIAINSFIKRRYQWTDLTNIILKDGLLTLDFKNNRLLQKETISGIRELPENLFNDYCRKQLSL